MKCSSGQQTERKQFLRDKLKEVHDKQVLLFLLGDSYFLIYETLSSKTLSFVCIAIPCACKGLAVTVCYLRLLCSAF